MCFCCDFEPFIAFGEKRGFVAQIIAQEELPGIIRDFSRTSCHAFFADAAIEQYRSPEVRAEVLHFVVQIAQRSFTDLQLLGSKGNSFAVANT